MSEKIDNSLTTEEKQDRRVELTDEEKEFYKKKREEAIVKHERDEESESKSESESEDYEDYEEQPHERFFTKFDYIANRIEGYAINHAVTVIEKMKEDIYKQLIDEEEENMPKIVNDVKRYLNKYFHLDE